MIQPTELAELFLQGNDREALKQVQQFLDSHNRKKLFDQLLTPAMYHIGELWETNAISVADEHLATAICDFVVSVIDKRREEEHAAKRKVMVLGPEGEEHYIGLKMVSSLFREHDWSVNYLGPNMPLDHAMEAANRWQPDAIALSAALVYRMPTLKAYINKFKELAHAPAIIVGGRAAAFESSRILIEEGAILVKDLEQLEHWIKTGEEPDDEYRISI
ncbi:B12 binding domain protein [Planococcus massiliensis]|uniref:B12 binding domain protein n=1 Tax=Planococcus massiliensis TaxID=1499687 RepID=A0A098EIR3_9BACL|nr:cobalamin-dependent protein [Planococcus massiliensis]CEG22168.1 B12 binding domain protein [Planococcus massiliensis]